MSTEVTDDHPLQALPADSAENVGRSRRRHKSSKHRSIPLFADEHPGVSRLYTVAMMADVLRVPRATVRHWLRGGLLEPARRSGSIEWFAFPQLVVGRQLAKLLETGLSLRDIDTKLAGLAPGGAAEAARMVERIVADGRRLSIRRNDCLLGAGGQLQLGFYTEALGENHGLGAAATEPRGENRAKTPADAHAAPAIIAAFGQDGACEDDLSDPASVTELLDLAADLESAGSFAEAAEALRAVLQAAGPTAQIVFMLAELLYRAGDLTAARERYYSAVELDADHLEARSSLGCVLAELGEHELAVAALDGVLRQQPDYADAHWHMAGVLHDMGHEPASRRHLRTFLTLAPESPWADMARDRLASPQPAGT